MLFAICFTVSPIIRYIGCLIRVLMGGGVLDIVLMLTFRSLNSLKLSYFTAVTLTRVGFLFVVFYTYIRIIL